MDFYTDTDTDTDTITNICKKVEDIDISKFSNIIEGIPPPDSDPPYEKCKLGYTYHRDNNSIEIYCEEIECPSGMYPHTYDSGQLSCIPCKEYQQENDRPSNFRNLNSDERILCL